MTRKPQCSAPVAAASVDAELLALAAEFHQVDARLMEINAEIKADASGAMTWDGLGAGVVHDRWWEIVDRVIDTPAFTVPGWVAKGSGFPVVLRDLVGLDSTTADHRLTLSLVLDMQRHGQSGLDADLIAACAAFDAAHAETKAPRGETDADDEILARAVERWYVTLYATVAIPARTAAGQQAKLQVVYTALWDAVKDEPICGNREEFAALRVLAELIGVDLVLPAEDPEPDAALPADAQPGRLTEDGVAQDDAIFDLESVFADMRADIAIIGHIATSEREISPEVWRRIEDHLDLACDTLESSWQVAREHRRVLRDALKAERAANKELERARSEDAAPGSALDIERAEAMWTMLRSLARLSLEHCDKALSPAA
jgi:hypothetical protein